ncbi:MogA/MoaB family molybdenum cofactor biosynthesis protein [Merismopedia glauca]|uniref:Molybdenum cofactor biosynthesis protein B n=1 Tax=Merismopedia glauca CCAP 1448/3 TaxID=1296344 RepID=A0A2T1C1K4_9CYAN|nr:molybdenum cofactor biosynthesis protein B [Merismopedia glauca]PSB02122.1 molybdenum cofactor biosynthesis protein [Merismopedia glauca CCAP 1448/3]
MNQQPHADISQKTVCCAVITVSDSRSQDNDKSGQSIRELLLLAGHQIGFYEIIKDEPSQIRARLDTICRDSTIQAIIFNGGTGIAPRDRTYETLEPLLEKVLPGFGEIFRFLSYQEIGSRAIASRAIAGTYQNRVIFSIPGSTTAVKLAMEKLILPELAHLVRLVSL